MTVEPSDDRIVGTYGQRALDSIRAIIEICDRLADFAEIGAEDFIHDTRTQWAVEAGLMRIGECVNRLPHTLRTDYPDQPWRQIIGMRNLAAHQYDDLDPRRVWRTLTNDVPALRRYLVEVVVGPPPGE